MKTSKYLTANIKDGYAHVVFDGVYSADAFLDALGTGIDIAIENNHSVVLLDVREMTGPIPDTSERFLIGSRAAEIQREKPQLVGVAVLGNEPFIDKRRFGETVAINRAAVGRVFSSEAAALSWIEQAS